MRFPLHDLIVVIICGLIVIGRTLDCVLSRFYFGYLLVVFPLEEWLSFEDARKLIRAPRTYARRALMMCAFYNLLDTRITEGVFGADRMVTPRYRDMANEQLGFIEFFDYRMMARPRFRRRIKKVRLTFTPTGIPIPVRL